jgi:sugar lactone lactonase YvrE
MAPAIHCLDPRDGSARQWPAPAKVGWVVPASGGQLVAGLNDGLYSFDPASSSFDKLLNVEDDLPNNRLNDAGADNKGRIWFGTMDDLETDASGRFYMYDGRDARPLDIPAVCITNGPAANADASLLYAVDTLGLKIVEYPILADGSVGLGRVFAEIDPADGYPDGVTCDAEGGVWLALWGGWSARRYDRNGEITDIVEFPAAQVTKIALGGPDGRTAYATTARKGLDEAALAKQPLAGDVFTFRTSVPGIAVAAVPLST